MGAERRRDRHIDAVVCHDIEVDTQYGFTR